LDLAEISYSDQLVIAIYGITNPTSTRGTSFFGILTYSGNHILDENYFFGQLAFSEEP